MNTDCILESIREAIERDWCGIDGDLLPICISQSTHSFSIVGQVKLGALYAVLVEEPVFCVAEALLARAIYSSNIS